MPHHRGLRASTHLALLVMSTFVPGMLSLTFSFQTRHPVPIMARSFQTRRAPLVFDRVPVQPQLGSGKAESRGLYGRGRLGAVQHPLAHPTSQLATSTIPPVSAKHSGP